MSKLVWDEVGQKLYESGVRQGVLYPTESDGTYGKGVAWNGLTSVNESPDGASATDLWADDSKYVTLRSAENYKSTIEAYTYPDEFKPCDGQVEVIKGVTIGQQPRKSFGFGYRTGVGNDVLLDDYAYKLHLVYGCTVAPSQKQYQTNNDSPAAVTMSWEATAVPVPVIGHKPTATLVIESKDYMDEAGKAKLKALEDVLYGTDQNEPRLPLPAEVFQILSGESA